PPPTITNLESLMPPPVLEAMRSTERYAVRPNPDSPVIGVLLAPRLFQERPLLEFRERLPKLLLRVHHDWAVPGHPVLKRLSRDQEEPNPVVPCLHGDLVAPIIEY